MFILLRAGKDYQRHTTIKWMFQAITEVIDTYKN